MNIGLVLSGGMAKGAYQIGALKALEEYIPRSQINCISCASVGVLNGYAYATGNLPKAEALWRSLCCDDSRMIINQLLRSSLLQQNISSLYDPEKPLSNPLYCTLLDLEFRNIIYKDLSGVDMEKIPAYLKASVAMPIYNKAVKIGNHSFYDGAMVDNIPVHPLLKHNLDLIICMYFDDTCYKFESTYFDNKVIKITFPSESIVKQSLVFQSGSIEKMIADGYDRANFILRFVLGQGTEDLDSIYRNIEQLNRNSQDKALRITGDLLVTNLNKITQKLTKRKII